jgi:hypothetical protein
MAYENVSTMTPQAYDLAEAQARKELPNRVIEAFAPAAFNVTSYPIHIDDPGELWRYIDVMHEMRGASQELLGGFTAEEFDLFQRAVRFMVALTLEKFGRPLHCQNALFRAMNIFRYIRAMKPRVVMELGPGSGYVGLLCILDGIGLIGCDNTQAFYLTQNLIWSAAAGEGKFVDLAEDAQSLRDILGQDLVGRVVHIPWWKIVDMDLASLPGRVDLVTANHCLAEMNQSARKYFQRLSRSLLRHTLGPFMFEGWGASYINSQEMVLRDFVAAGYGLAHHDARVTALVTGAWQGTASLPLPVAAHRRLRNLLRWTVVLPPLDYGYRVVAHRSGTAVSNIIAETQQAHGRAAKVDGAEISRFVAQAYGVQPAYMEDRFLTLLDE